MKRSRVLDRTPKETELFSTIFNTDRRQLGHDRKELMHLDIDVCDVFVCDFFVDDRQ